MTDFVDIIYTSDAIGGAVVDIALKNKVMMSLGSFIFSTDTAAYQSITKTVNWRWAEQQRFGKVDTIQYVGKQLPEISFSGEIYTGYKYIGDKPIRDLMLLGDEVEPQILITGTGDVLGYWVITSFSGTDDKFFVAGYPRHQQFQMTIKYYAENIYNP